MRFRVFYYFISTHDFQIGAPAVAGIGAPSVPSRRTRLSLMPVPFGYMNHEKTEIASESCEVTVSTKGGAWWGETTASGVMWGGLGHASLIPVAERSVTAVSRSTLTRPASAPPPSGNTGSTDYGPVGEPTPPVPAVRTCAPTGEKFNL